MTNKDIEAKVGQVWTFPDDDPNLYVISKIDIGGLPHFSAVNINSGDIGSPFYTEKEAVDLMVFVAHSIDDLNKFDSSEKITEVKLYKGVAYFMNDQGRIVGLLLEDDYKKMKEK